MSIRPVETAEDWTVVGWLWQAFRSEMSTVTGGLPRPDGRFTTRDLDPAPGSEDHAGYLWWTRSPHGEAPAAFMVVEGLTGARRSVSGFWVAHAVRRDGVGSRLALDVLARHAGPWQIGFQHDNAGAVEFWRRVADRAWGAAGWTETERPVPGKPEVPPDHFIETC